MYRNGDNYEKVDQLARNILIDYGVTSFPLDLFDLAVKMGFTVIPYSAYDDNIEALQILLKKSRDGFSIPASLNKPPMILYNDRYGDHLTPARLQSTVGHEIKHIVDNDGDDSEDDLCDHFARYLRCPTPYVIYMGYNTTTELIAKFDISASQASNTLHAIKNRKKKYGETIFDNERELINLLCQQNKKKIWGRWSL